MTMNSDSWAQWTTPGRVTMEEFDKPEGRQDYVSNQFYAWCAKNRY